MKRFFIAISILCVLCFSPLSAKLKGKADLGGAYAEIDIISNGNVVRTLDMHGFGGNATVAVYHCFCLKPRFLVLTGNGDYHTLDLGAGVYIPVGSHFSILPNVGVSRSILKFYIDLPSLGMTNLKQKFRSWGRYVAMDGTWKVTHKVSLTASVQYAWSRNRTTITPILSTKTESRGFNISAMLDYYLTDHWSINLAVADTRSMSKEKDGSKGKGMRLGLGYCF